MDLVIPFMHMGAFFFNRREQVQSWRSKPLGRSAPPRRAGSQGLAGSAAGGTQKRANWQRGFILLGRNDLRKSNDSFWR
jgi:hypothetical protein